MSPRGQITRERRAAPLEAADRADLAGLVRGEEVAFLRLVDRHHAALDAELARHALSGDAAARALVGTWSAFLDVVGAAEPVGGVEAMLVALLREQLGAGRAARPRPPGGIGSRRAAGPRPCPT